MGHICEWNLFLRNFFSDPKTVSILFFICWYIFIGFGHVGMMLEWKSFADQVLDADCLGHWHEACAQRSMVLLTRM